MVLLPSVFCWEGALSLPTALGGGEIPSRIASPLLPTGVGHTVVGPSSAGSGGGGGDTPLTAAGAGGTLPVVVSWTVSVSMESTFASTMNRSLGLEASTAPVSGSIGSIAPRRPRSSPCPICTALSPLLGSEPNDCVSSIISPRVATDSCGWVAGGLVASFASPAVSAFDSKVTASTEVRSEQLLQASTLSLTARLSPTLCVPPFMPLVAAGRAASSLGPAPRVGIASLFSSTAPGA